MDPRRQDIGRRRKALGMDRKFLASASGVDRGTLARIEEDADYRPRDATLESIIRTLDRIEEESGIDELHRSMVTGTLDLPGGGRFVVKGNPADVAETIAALMAEWHQSP